MNMASSRAPLGAPQGAPATQRTAGSIQEDQRKRKPQENALAMVQSLWDNKGLLRSGDTRT